MCAISRSSDKYGTIIGEEDDGDDNEVLYLVQFGSGDEMILHENQFVVERKTIFPAWKTMWAFSEGIDREWLEGRYTESAIQEMANCGFRVYESEDYGYVFGIDGAGYNFYEHHWIPLYDARGLHWHVERDGA